MYLDIRDFEKLKKAILDTLEEFDGISLSEICEEIEESDLKIEFAKSPLQTTVNVGASGPAEAVCHALYELRYLDGDVIRYRDMFFVRKDEEK